MRSRTIAVVAGLILFLAVGLGVRYGLGPKLQEWGLIAGSDATKIKATMTVAGDNYIGYWFISSSEFVRRFREKGYALNWHNEKDSVDYADRNARFAKGEYDIMGLPVPSYLFHSQTHRYPGVIPVAISDSKGADSIVAYKDALVGQSGRDVTINDLNNPNLKICYTPDSPSSFLLNIAESHFPLDDLKNGRSWQVETNGSSEALKKFTNHECSVAILWEPDVSKALAMPGVVSVFGSDQVSGMIIDAFVVRRQLVQDNPAMVQVFFRTYFETIAYYGANRDQMIAQMSRDSAFSSPAAVEQALKRISWFDLSANCKDWFGIGTQGQGLVATSNNEKIIDTISEVTKVMIDVGNFKADPLQSNPYIITNSDILKPLCAEAPAQVSAIGVVMPQSIVFKALTDKEWSALRAIGNMKILPINFDTSTSRLTLDGQTTVDQVAQALVNNYPQYRVVVKGHTAPSADELANVALSQERADVVRNYMQQIHSVDPSRVRAMGVGSSQPLQRLSGEGDRAYRSRLARVEFVLLEDK